MKKSAYSYKYGNNIYINLTNKCSNNCEFCIRINDNFAEMDTNLWLDHEPTVQEVIDSISKSDMSLANEVVFCGYGEPTYRINELVELGKYFKGLNKITRLNTNGQGNLIHNKDITPMFEGAIDIINISLNEVTAEKYQNICHSIYGETAFFELQDFAKKCKQYVPKVILSVVDVIPAQEIEEGRKIAEKLGVEYRVRAFE